MGYGIHSVGCCYVTICPFVFEVLIANQIKVNTVSYIPNPAVL